MLKPNVTSGSSDFFDFDGFHGIAALAPSLEAAFEGAHTEDTVMQKRERRTGARSFVWSRTIKNYFLIARDFVLASLDFFEGDGECAGDTDGVVLHLQAVTQIDDGYGLVALEHIV